MNTDTAITMLLAMGVAAVVSFLSTPMVKSLAYKVGAIDVPKDNRRMHKVPIPRLGGLAIFLAFLLSVLVFANIDRQMQGILLGATMIVVLGVMDDIMALNALPKLIVQILSRLRHPVCLEPQRLFEHDVSEPRLVVVSDYDHLDRRDHKRGEPHRRPRRPCLRRFDHQRHFDARHRAARL